MPDIRTIHEADKGGPSHNKRWGRPASAQHGVRSSNRSEDMIVETGLADVWPIISTSGLHRNR